MRYLVAFFAAGALVAAGCSSKAPAPGAGPVKVAVIPKGTTHDFWKSVHAGALKAAAELDVEVLWKGPVKEDDREDQIKTVEDFVNSAVSGICLAPLDDTALRPSVASAIRQNIPVVIFDSDLKDAEYVSFVATDNYKGGRLAGEEMARLLDGKGRVLVLRYQEGSASTYNREKGFLDTMKEHPGIQVLSANQYGGATRETAFRASENLLAPLKKGAGLNVDGIFTPNESTTFGMLRALQDAGVAGKVRFVGFDSAVELVQALEKGQINGLVLQDPMRMGYLSVKTMVAHLKGERVDKRVDTGARLVTSANMKEPGIADLISPPLEKWLKE